ncbi:MAG TPA: HDOD domain-containing protein [Pseudomonadales bacterium]|nr:HDOD domain-containing protein [Pseudomonadales bacterium]
MPKLDTTKSAEYELLDAYLDSIKHLPPEPTLLVELIDLFRNPDADVDEIVAVLRRDTALSVEVLRRCNSSYFGLDTPVTDINEAVFQLGFHEVYQMTVSLSGMQTMKPKEAIPGFSAEALQRHSSIAAIAAGELALEVDESEGIAFTAGLLHDVGKLVLALGEREKYVAMMDDCKRTGASLSEKEKNLFGFNHDEVGARLLQRWGVPVEVVTPALRHNSPKPDGEWQRFVAITSMASRLANHIEQEKVLVPFILLPGVRPLTEFLQLSNSQIPEWETSVRNKVREMPELLRA